MKLSEAETGIRDDDIWKNCMSMLAAVTEYPEDTELGFAPLSRVKVNDGVSVVVMDMAVPSAAADRTGLQFRAEPCHEGVKEKLR